MNGDIICVNLWIDGVESGIQLTRSKPKTCADSKEGGQDWKDVNQIPDPSEDPITEDGIEARLHGHWKVFSETHETKKKSNQTVDYPSMDSYNQFFSYYIFVTNTEKTALCDHFVTEINC